jgi:4-amino-4-deoxy-L-arabinose transferase-like glycosyltransferase
MNDTTRNLRRALLAAIILIAAFFRFFHLGTNPPALFRDEAEKGYTAYSLLKTGGYSRFILTPTELTTQFVRHPLFIHDYKTLTSAIYQYCAVPSVALFGLTEFATRLPSALVGTLTILTTFLLVRLMFGEWMALGAALLLAVSPWHVIFSRWALQGIFLPLFISAGLYFFFLGQRRSPRWWLASAASFALAFYTYEVARLFIPLFLVALVIIYLKEIRAQWRFSLLALATFLIVASPALYVSITPQGAARFDSISIFRKHQPAGEVARMFFSNYIKHLSPRFLFLRGDELPRHGVAYFGEMYHFEAPFVLIGLVTLLVRRRRTDWLLLLWFLLFPVASSLTTVGIPHALRTIVALPMPSIIVMLGIGTLFRWIQPKGSDQSLAAENGSLRTNVIGHILIIVLCVVLVVSAVAFADDLFEYYPAYSALFWDYGVKQAVAYIEAAKGPETHVFVSGYLTSKVYLLLFYKRTDPQALREHGVQALRYSFLPTAIPVDSIWNQIPSDSLIMLYPGEKTVQTPIYSVPTPMTARYEKPYPAFYIYRKP